MKIKSRLALILLFSMLLSSVSVVWASEEQSGLYSKEIEKAIGYLQRVQNDDGGFPYLPGQASSQAVSCWVIMALAEAGESLDNSKWAPAGHTPLDFIQGCQEDLAGSCDLARTLLSLTSVSAGSEYQGIDLVPQIIALQQDNGHFAQVGKGEETFINSHIWSILALHSAGESIPELEKAKKWLIERQNSDGGFGWCEGIPSDADDTAAAIRALLLMGEDPDRSLVIDSSLAYLKSCQGEDGGFNSGYLAGDKSNASSDAWVIQALLRAEQSPLAPSWSRNKRNALDHLLGLQDDSGFFHYSAGVTAGPVQTTATALIALGQLARQSEANPVLGPNEPLERYFTDLDEAYWAYPAIMELVQAEILKGYPDGSFQPEKSVNRAEFATMIVKCLGLTIDDKIPGSEFQDLPQGFWALESIQACVQKGYVNGMPGGIFQPDGNITGAQLATILVRTGPEKAPDPAPGPYWYEELVQLAVARDLLFPDFDPLTPASRAQCAYSIMKLRESLELN